MGISQQKIWIETKPAEFITVGYTNDMKEANISSFMKVVEALPDKGLV